MEPQKPGNSSEPGPEVVEKQRVAKGRAAQRVGSTTVQNEMRGVLGWMTADAARRILDSVNSREIKSLTEGFARCSKEAQILQWKPRGPVCRKI